MHDQPITGRFVEYMSMLADGETDPVMGTYPGLENLRWFDPAHFPLCAELARRFDSLSEEIRGLPAGTFFPDGEKDAVSREGDWRIVPVYGMGLKYESTTQFLPTLIEIVESRGAMTTLGGGVFVSRLPPGASIGFHRGPTNTRVRCHLGIKIPSGDCGIEVDGESRAWAEGSCLLLNDHLSHRVWNHTSEERIVPVLDVWHPDLTATESRLLAGLHVYASVQADASSKWRAEFWQVRANQAAT